MASATFCWGRVNAMIVRYYYGTLRSFDRLTDSFYWVALDLVLWGITAGAVQQQLQSNGSSFLFSIVGGVIMWSIVHRSQTDIGMGLLDELWNRNLVNIFASPLTYWEWLVSLLLFGLGKSVVTVAFGSLIGWALYNFLLLDSLGWYLIPLFFLLVINGWWIGLLVQALIFRLSTRAQALAWTLIWLVAPFCAIYFPVVSLPSEAQAISRFIPASYVFEELRRVLMGGSMVWSNLAIAAMLNLGYLALCIFLSYRSFQRVLNQGLARLS